MQQFSDDKEICRLSITIERCNQLILILSRFKLNFGLATCYQNKLENLKINFNLLTCEG